MFEQIIDSLLEVDVKRVIAGSIFGSLVVAVVYGTTIMM